MVQAKALVRPPMHRDHENAVALVQGLGQGVGIAIIGGDDLPAVDLRRLGQVVDGQPHGLAAAFQLASNQSADVPRCTRDHDHRASIPPAR